MMTSEGARRSQDADASVDWIATGACFLFASLGPFIFGFDIGVSPGAVRAVTTEALSSEDWSDTVSLECNLLPAMSMLGALMTSLGLLLAGNLMGRRLELLLAALLYGTSSVLCQLVQAIPQLLALRLAYGVGMGFSMHAAAAFIAETCPASHRGMLICLKEAMLVGGILKGYLVSSMVDGADGGWRHMYSAAAPVALVMGLGVWFLPESPRWLLLYEWRVAVHSRRRNISQNRRNAFASAAMAAAAGPLSLVISSGSSRSLRQPSPLGSTRPDGPADAVLQPLLQGQGEDNAVQGDSPPHLTILRDSEYSLVGGSGGVGQSCAGQRNAGRDRGDSHGYDEQLERQWKWLWQQQGLPSPLVGQGPPLFSPAEVDDAKESPGQQGEAHISGMPLADRDGSSPTAGPGPFSDEAEGLLDGKAILLQSPNREAAKLQMADGGGMHADTDRGCRPVGEVSQREGDYPPQPFHLPPSPSPLVLLPHHLRGHGGDSSTTAASTASPQVPWRHSHGAGSSGAGGGGGSSWSCGPAVREALAQAWGRRAVRHPLLFERELAAMMLSAREATHYSVSPVRLLGHPLYYKPLLVGLSLMLFQQVTGQADVMYESNKILEQAGVGWGQDQMVGIFRLVMTVIAAANVDVWGRRPLLLVGATGIVISLSALAVAQWDGFIQLAGGTDAVAVVSVTAMLLFLACFQISFGPISWLYCGEIFPLAVRGPAMAAADAAGCFSSLAVKMLLPELHRTVGSLGTYLVFVVASLVAVLFTAIVPETANMTLEEIELMWSDNNLPSFESASLSEWLPTD